MNEELLEKDWLEINFFTLLHSKKENINELYEKKLKRIVQEKPKLSSSNIRMILLDILEYKKLRNFLSITKEDREFIGQYFDKIYNLYRDKITGEELVTLCTNINDKKLCEKIIRENYKKIRLEMRKTLYVPLEEISELDSIWEINELRVKPKCNRKYKASIINTNSSVFHLFYRYFEADIKIFINNNIEKYSMWKLNVENLYHLLEWEIKNNHLNKVQKIVEILSSRDFQSIDIVSSLSNMDWFNILKNEKLLKILLYENIELANYCDNKKVIFQDFFLKLLISNTRINRMNIEKIKLRGNESIYSFKFLMAINLLAKENYNDNKSNDLFLICFKIFLKEFLKHYKDILTNDDIVYLVRIFRRGIQRKSIYKIFLINNRKNLIYNYKSDRLLKDTSKISIEDLKNYNAKQYNSIKKMFQEKVNKDKLVAMFFSKFVNDEYDQYILISLNLLNYEVTRKLVYYDIDNLEGITEYLKGKSFEFIEAFKTFVLETTNTDEILKDYSCKAYLSAFEKIFLSGQKPTLNKMNKIIKSIKNLLVPYNADIEENLKLLDNVVKGEPFLEKINGIKLYEIYRKRIKSSIPNDYGKYGDLDYGLVSLHDKRIISNGIGKYLLSDNKKASSCLTPNGKAKTCLEHGAINPNGRFFKIEKNNEIVAYSWVWRRGDILCFDNIELTEEIKSIRDFERVIYEIYLHAAKEIVEKTRNEMNGGIKLVLIGRNAIDVKNQYIDNLQSLNELTDEKIVPFSKKELYLKDSEHKVILFGEYNDKLDTTDVEPIYLYERLKVKKFDELDKHQLKIQINSIYYDYCLQNNVKYVEIENRYNNGYIGEDWFIGYKDNGGYDFYYADNDKRLFYEAKRYIKNIEDKKPNIYIPSDKKEKILNMENISIDIDKIENYLKELNYHDYKIPNTYFSHTTKSIQTLNSIFEDGAITSSYYGNHEGGLGSNGKHYICIAKVGSPVYNSYKKTGTIILDDNMQIFNGEDIAIPNNLIGDFQYTSYPIRMTGTEGEYQVKNIISREHFDSLLATKGDILGLAQVMLLNELYDLNLPIVLESTMSKIDTAYVKKYIKI